MFKRSKTLATIVADFDRTVSHLDNLTQRHEARRPDIREQMSALDDEHRALAHEGNRAASIASNIRRLLAAE